MIVNSEQKAYMEERITRLSDEVVRLVKLLAEEKQVNMNLCAMIEKLERSKKDEK